MGKWRGRGNGGRTWFRSPDSRNVCIHIGQESSFGKVLRGQCWCLSHDISFIMDIESSKLNKNVSRLLIHFVLFYTDLTPFFASICPRLYCAPLLSWKGNRMEFCPSLLSFAVISSRHPAAAAKKPRTVYNIKLARYIDTRGEEGERHTKLGDNTRERYSGWNCTPTNQGWSFNSIISIRSPLTSLPTKVRPAFSRRSTISGLTS